MTEAELVAVLGEAINSDFLATYTRTEESGGKTYAFVEGYLDLNRLAKKVLSNISSDGQEN